MTAYKILHLIHFLNTVTQRYIGMLSLVFKDEPSYYHNKNVMHTNRF